MSELPKNTLDLRPKAPVRIIERIVREKRRWYVELSKLIMVIIIASGVVWGISKADSLTTPPPAVEDFSAVGIVSSVATSSLSIENATPSDNSGLTSFTFDLTDVSTIETASYGPLALTDINPGDKIIVQGVSTNGTIDITRIISFATSTTATTTDSTATTTDEIATSTDTSIGTTTATTTIPSNIGTSTATSTEQGGTSTTTATTTDTTTSSSTPDIGTTTSPSIGTSTSSTATSTDDTATTTPDTVATSTPDLSVTPNTSTPSISTSTPDNLAQTTPSTAPTSTP